MTEKRKAVFLDRDGVLNREMGDYVCKFEDFHVLDNFDALKELQDRGYLLLVATNQGGLAKGWYSEEELAKMHRHLKQVYHERGVELTDFFYCPHHPNFTGDCDCRKPKPGLLLQGIEKYNIDPAKSYFIGDRDRDVEAGEAAGVKGILIDSDQPISTVLDLIE
ncbi:MULTISPECIES: D-glycero-alpha-D-manno-heptose-1,7-bisphosphate 7-phosphatase [unclassified Mucilaginibacter]|uniref:D-glycero-alpha-D-manno-heptose-1,7-bisphosphate 7-phosphatase n=1 Tax=unclassified Mucilaginibacter TaxID=2617802 RepID=UPI00095949E5|nr:MULTISPECIES: HAD family hydrolase [unclassified Mucilaginibacter]OJW14750.1 MAG: histidinol phosphate phosphatase [Mucilaginibacter sp. 44-25]PLW90158.1 MAG: HAD family hydrolase [Mucilaginibacter sp.]HEK21398.1 HAD family hydrolase [Bacteroidota bacterium]